MHNNNIYDSRGQILCIGNRLARGGEAEVFEVPTTTLVAKIYTEPINEQKQSKIIKMAKLRTAELEIISAWPISPIHIGKSGPIQGFIMPRILGEQIHRVYGPEDRTIYFQDFNWCDLVKVAYNTAVVFQTIHSHGFIIGDVNQNNLYVSQNGLVKILDCDSFQIRLDGVLHLCPVRSPQFTPPELQAKSNVGMLQRTVNHDCFGLAAVLFHILFLGMHPYAGIYLGRNDMPVEKAIEEYRFAFGKDAKWKKMYPPINSIGLSMLPKGIAEMFEAAFSEQSAKTDARPRPAAWVHALGGLIDDLRSCSSDPKHKYFNQLPACPWCELARETGFNAFENAAHASAPNAQFDMQRAWQAILDVPHPGPLQQIDNSCIKVMPCPLPPLIQSARIIITSARITSILIFFLHITSLKQNLNSAALAIAQLLFVIDEDKSEANKRRAALEDAKAKHADIMERYQHDDSERKFLVQIDELNKLKRDYEGLDDQYNREKKWLLSKARSRAKEVYLRKHVIDAVAFPDIPEEQLALLKLHQHQIKTAYQVTDEKMIRVVKRGFSREYANRLIAWKNKLVEELRLADPIEIDQIKVVELDHKYTKKRLKLEKALGNGAGLLLSVNADIRARRYKRHVEILAALEDVEQAEADLIILNRKLTL